MSKEMNMSRKMTSGSKEMGMSSDGGGHLYTQANETRNAIIMFGKLMAMDNDAAIAILRLVLGVVFFAHGAQKALGWFGGYGFTGTMGFPAGVDR